MNQVVHKGQPEAALNRLQLMFAVCKCHVLHQTSTLTCTIVHLTLHAIIPVPNGGMQQILQHALEPLYICFA